MVSRRPRSTTGTCLAVQTAWYRGLLVDCVVAKLSALLHGLRCLPCRTLARTSLDQSCLHRIVKGARCKTSEWCCRAAMNATGKGCLGEVEVVMVGNGAGCLHARDRHCGQRSGVTPDGRGGPNSQGHVPCRGRSREPMQCWSVESLCELLFCPQEATRKCAAEAVSLVSVCGLVLCCLDTHVK